MWVRCMESICCRSGGGLGQGSAHLCTHVWWRVETRSGRASSRFPCALRGPSSLFGLLHREGKGNGACLAHLAPRERREPG